jgi:RHS repeat-associated protein
MRGRVAHPLGFKGAGICALHKFTGYERDSETGNYAMARYYGARYGSFLSPDPTDGNPSDPQSLNRYPYVRNNPATLTDPSGMDWAVSISRSSSGGAGAEAGIRAG